MYHRSVFIHIFSYFQDCHRGIDDWQVILFVRFETHKQLEETETFWQHRSETFYPLDLIEKEEYLF